MFIKKIFSLLLLFAVVIGLFQSCKKEATLVPEKQSVDNSVSERNGFTPFTALTRSAIDHNASDDYEFVGRTLYEHYMYHSDKDPRSYFNFSDQQLAEIAAADAQFNDFKDLETEEAIIAQMISKGMIASASELDYLKNYFNQVLALADHIENIDNPAIATDFGTFYFDILALENSVKQNPNLTQEQKLKTLAFSSVIRNELKYLVASGQVEERGLNCIRGIKLKCWLRYGYVTWIKVAIYSAAILKSGGIAALAYTVSMITAVEKFLEKINAEDCKCSDEPLFDCNQPDGIVILANPCSSIQTVKAVGYGAHTLQYQWTLDLAKVVAVDYPGQANPITDEDFLRVQLVAPAQMADIGVRLIGCPDPESFTYHVVPDLPLAAAASSPGTLAVNGSNMAFVDQESHYFLSGTALASSSNTFSMSRTGPGNIIQNTGTTLRVLWTGLANQASVTGTVVGCTGQVVSATKTFPIVEP